VTFVVEWITEMARFAELSAEWDALLPSGRRPFDLHCWYTAWWRAFAGDDEIAICTVRDGGALVGAVPLQRHGNDLQAMANSHSGIFRPLASSPAAMDALIVAALQDSRKLILRDLRQQDPGIETVADDARGAGMLLLLEAGSRSSVVATGGELGDWVEQSHSTWKKRLRRYRRKMDKDYEATFEIARSPTDLEAELAEGFALEAGGWKGAAGTAIVSTPETADFYREIAAAFHDRGELRLSRIALDGEAVAFSFCIEHGGRLYSLKAGYDESFRRIVPGLVMQLSIIEACFEREVETYELLGEETEWKAKLATSTLSHVTLRAYRRNLFGVSRYLYRGALRPRLRSVRRRLRGVGK
jgi:CelD/BcsL family acetyltransferase involved in cellulose biosynthesis